MNKSCIVKAHTAGFFSLVNCVITCMDLYENVAVDWRDSLYCKEDLWPMLFEALPPLSEGEHDVVTNYPDQWLTYRHAGLLYQGKGRTDWRQCCHRHWQKIKPLPRVTGFVDWFVEDYFRKRPVVAAIVRAHGHAGEQLTDRSQTLDEYAAAIEAELCGNDVYIASSDEQSLSWFCDRFNVFQHPGTKRSETRDVDRHRVVKQDWRDALNVLQEALIISQADVLVHPISNIATACLYMNTDLKSIYLS